MRKEEGDRRKGKEHRKMTAYDNRRSHEPGNTNSKSLVFSDREMTQQ